MKIVAVEKASDSKSDWVVRSVVRRREPSSTNTAIDVDVCLPFLRPLTHRSEWDKSPFDIKPSPAEESERGGNHLNPFAAMKQLLAMMKPGDALPPSLPITMYLPYSMCMAQTTMTVRCADLLYDAATAPTPVDRFAKLVAYLIASVLWLPPYGVRPLESVLGETCSAEDPKKRVFVNCEHVSVNPPTTLMSVACPETGTVISRSINVDVRFQGVTVNVKNMGTLHGVLGHGKERFSFHGGDCIVRIMRNMCEFIGPLTFLFESPAVDGGGYCYEAVLTPRPKPMMRGELGVLVGEMYDITHGRAKRTLLGNFEGSSLAPGQPIVFNKMKLCTMPPTDIMNDFHRLHVGSQRLHEPLHSLRVWGAIIQHLANKKPGRAHERRKRVDAIAEAFVNDKTKHGTVPYDPVLFIANKNNNSETDNSSSSTSFHVSAPPHIHRVWWEAIATYSSSR
eukprot:PhM_4_TR15703/c4_g4_i1/m.85069